MPLSLPQLFTAGVECGHTAARVGAQAPDRHGLRAARAPARALPRGAGAREGRPRAARGRAARDAAQVPFGADPDVGDADAGRPDADAGRADAGMHAGASRDVARRGARPHRRARDLEGLADDRAAAQRRATASRSRARAFARGDPGVLPLAAAVGDGDCRSCATRARRRWRSACARRSCRKSASSRRRPCSSEVEEAIAPLAFAPAAAPLVSIVIPVYGKPLLTYTCLKSVHAHTPHDMIEVIVVDDASPEPAAAALSAVTGVRFERNAAEPGLHRHLQSRRRARARRVHRVPQQRHDRHARAGSRRCCACFDDASGRGTRRRQARLSRRPPAGSGRHRVARRLGVELRPRRRSRPPRVQLRARSRLLLGRVPRDSRRRCSASSAASTRATRPRTTRTPTSPSPCARPAARSTTSRSPTVVHFEGQTSGTDETVGRQAPPGREPGDVRRKVGGRAGDASRQRRQRRTRARPLGQAARARHRRVHADARPRRRARCACWRSSRS